MTPRAAGRSARWTLVVLVALLGLQGGLGSVETPSLDEETVHDDPGPAAVHDDETGDATTTPAEAHYTCFDNFSWAIGSQQLSDPARQSRYDNFLEGCRNEAKDQALSMCDAEEEMRMQMNNFQPRSMRNYTETGFLKTRAPEAVFKLVQEFWLQNKDKASVEWHIPTTYHNNWEVPTTILRVDDKKMVGGGKELQGQIANAARGLMEEWTGQRLTSSSVYGIRIYHNQSILVPHVDRLPLVSSAIINVAQDCDEPWPLEVYDHDGVAHNVTMEPGDMVMYESHSVLHGRPHPLVGKFYANVFIHFEPLGPIDDDHAEINVSGLPPYVVQGTAWEMVWRDKNPGGWWVLNDPRLLVQRGDLDTLNYLSKIKPENLHAPDKAGWRPIHEAARQGNLAIAQFLVDHGADVNSKARIRYGYAPLSVAREYHGNDHPVSKLLESMGAVPFDGTKNKTSSDAKQVPREEL